MVASWSCPGVAQPGRASEPPPRTVGDEDAVGVRPVRSHVSLTRLTVDTGVSPENHENWFGEFKIEVATSMRLRSPGPFPYGTWKKVRLTLILPQAYGSQALAE